LVYSIGIRFWTLSLAHSCPTSYPHKAITARQMSKGPVVLPSALPSSVRSRPTPVA
jgi:hypothetical protein